MSLSMPGLCALSRGLASSEVSAGPDALRSRATRRAQGAFFTPPALVSFVVNQALDRRFAAGDIEWHSDGYPRLRILDPAAGDGRFLAEAAAALVRRGEGLGLHVDPGQIRRHCLLAMERDPEYAAIARDNLHGEATVHCAEALLSETMADQSVDLVLGNPPYLRSITLGQVDSALRDELRDRYAATSHGEWDLYAAFLEQGLAWLADGGVLAMVVPSRWWTAQWAGPLRESLCEQGAVHALVDFGDTQIFSDATVYTSLCFAGRTSRAHVEVARLGSPGWELGQVPVKEMRGGQAWDLSVGGSRKMFEQLREAGTPLGEIARIAKGTGTNADSVFLIDASAGPIESELLHPVLRGRDVLAFGPIPDWPKLLVPYDEQGRLISPEVLEEHYPLAHAHLRKHRELLEARERGRFAGSHFYCFGRPQNFAFLRDVGTKIVVPDVTREGRALLDTEAAMVLDSAYAIRLHEGASISHETLCGVLNSQLVGLWLRSQGIPLRGGYTRMKTAYLKGLPMPPPGDAADAIGEAVRAGASRGEVDELVRNAYGLSRASWNHGSQQ